MGIKFNGFRTRSIPRADGEGLSKAVVVKAVFLVDDLSEVAPLLDGFRALTARAAQAATETPGPAPKPAPEKNENVSNLDDARKKTNGKKTAAPKEEPPPSPKSDSDLPEEKEESTTPSGDEDGGKEEVAPAAPAGPRPKAKITPAMVEAPRFTDVVVALHKQGFTAKEIVAICGKIHGQVEAVKRVKPEELDKRVERVFEIEGLS